MLCRAVLCLLCRLLQVLRSAQRTLDVCVFTITCDEIADALLQAHQRGVRVRVISDNDQVDSCSRGSNHVIHACDICDTMSQVESMELLC